MVLGCDQLHAPHRVPHREGVGPCIPPENDGFSNRNLIFKGTIFRFYCQFSGVYGHVFKSWDRSTGWINRKRKDSSIFHLNVPWARIDIRLNKSVVRGYPAEQNACHEPGVHPFMGLIKKCLQRLGCGKGHKIQDFQKKFQKLDVILISIRSFSTSFIQEKYTFIHFMIY